MSTLRFTVLCEKIKEKIYPLVRKLEVTTNADQPGIIIQCSLREETKNPQDSHCFRLYVRPDRAKTEEKVIISCVYMNHYLKELGVRFIPYTCKDREVATKIAQFIRDLRYLLLHYVN